MTPLSAITNWFKSARSLARSIRIFDRPLFHDLIVSIDPVWAWCRRGNGNYLCRRLDIQCRFSRDTAGNADFFDQGIEAFMPLHLPILVKHDTDSVFRLKALGIGLCCSSTGIRQRHDREMAIFLPKPKIVCDKREHLPQIGIVQAKAYEDNPAGGENAPEQLPMKAPGRYA